jgi:hypothetical protein
MMMMTFITQGGEGKGNTHKKSKTTKSKGRGREEGASRALMMDDVVALLRIGCTPLPQAHHPLLMMMTDGSSRKKVESTALVLRPLSCTPKGLCDGARSSNGDWIIPHLGIGRLGNTLLFKTAQ